jgi:putative spermidine/putrescine transport system substrate-binding protein
LWNPEYKGKVGIFAVSGSAPSNYWLLAATARNGGNIERDDWMDHFSGLLEFRELEPKYYPSQDALVAGLQSGEVWLSINYRARNALLTVPGSETLGDVLPKEGSYADWYGAAIPKNAQNPEGAYAFIDIMLSPDVQEGFAEYFGYSPTVNNVTLSPEVLKKIGVDEDEIKRVYNIPTSFFVELAPRFKERWLQEYLQ